MNLNEHELELIAEIRQWATRSMSNQLQQVRTRSRPEYLVQGGPCSTWLNCLKGRPKQRYRLLRDLKRRGLLQQHSTSGSVSRWWPLEDGKPWIPTTP